METIKTLVIRKYGTHPQIAEIAKEINAIMARADAAWEACDRKAFSEAMRDLREYVPPDSRNKKNQ